jgi:plastocyanin
MEAIMQDRVKEICFAAMVLVVCGAAIAQAQDDRVLKGTVSLPREAGSVRDVVVYLDGRIGTAKSGKSVVDQKGMMFVPHVSAVVVGSAIEFLNGDPVPHNVFSTSPAKHFDLGMFNKGESRTVTLDAPGIVELRCNVHPKMRAFIVVLENEYFTIPDDQGNFQISGIPPGRYKLCAWHETLPAIETWVNLDEAKIRTVDLRLQNRESR